MTPSEARYTVYVDLRDVDGPTAYVSHHGRHIAVIALRTPGDCDRLGRLLADPSTPFLPTLT